MSKNKIQAYAVKVLQGVLVRKKNLNEMFADILTDHGIQNIPTIKEISYGVLRKYKTLDYWVTLCLKRPLDVYEVYILLLVALYQLNYTSTASYAVVNEAVNLASRIHRGKYKNLVNAILRNHLRSESKRRLIPTKNLEALYNLPLWWIDRIQNDYPEQATNIFSAYQTHPPLTLRVNLRKITVSEYIDILREQNMQAESWGGCCVHILKPVSVNQIPYFFEGYVSVQDWGAQQAAFLLDVEDGAYVLDACAAPGGKTGHILEQADCELLALDINACRLQKVQENLTRLHLSAKLKCADSALLESWWNGRHFDYILADIPCTASGVVKRNPDIRWLRQSDDADNMAKKCSNMIDNLWKCLKSTGKMLVVTCSIFRAENQDQLAGFLARNPDANLIKELQILPDSQRDGFYYALVQKS